MSQLNTPERWIRRFPWPKAEGHKYDRGTVLVAGGPMRCTGAAKLAALGALRAGAGIVGVACPAAALPAYASSLLSVMVHPYEHVGEFGALVAHSKHHVLLLGPGHGVGEATVEKVRLAMATGKPLVLDADALTSFAAEPETLFAALNGVPAVLTPHEGEFAALFGKMGAAGKREKAALQAAKESGVVVVLKGAHTVIADPDGRVLVNSNAPAWLATAGSGDVLGGMVAGLMAQGVEAFDAAAMAVWMHGEAANLHGPGLIAEDLPGLIPLVLEGLWRESHGG